MPKTNKDGSSKDSPGPSDERAERSGRTGGESAVGVRVGEWVH